MKMFFLRRSACSDLTWGPGLISFLSERIKMAASMAALKCTPRLRMTTAAFSTTSRVQWNGQGENKMLIDQFPLYNKRNVIS